MNEYEQLIKTLKQYPSIEWINQYFDLLKKLLIALNMENDDPRLAMSLTKQGTLPVNLGQRYVLKPVQGGYLRCIVRAAFEEEAVNGVFIFPFKRKGEMDAKWIEVHYPLGAQLPLVLYNACVDACMDILRRTKRSGFRKHHVSLLYDFTMEPAVRNEILDELKNVAA